MTQRPKARATHYKEVLVTRIAISTEELSLRQIQAIADETGAELDIDTNELILAEIWRV